MASIRQPWESATVPGVSQTFQIRRSKRVEWPSVALCIAIYGSFLGLTWFGATLPAAVFIPVGALVVAWHSSMQHEFIHGHPTPWRKLNRALGFVPLCLCLPFDSSRISHLVHHCDEQLTDPLDDPESYYWTAEAWRALGSTGRFIVRAHTTLAGRLLLGPAWNISRYLRTELRGIWNGDRLKQRIWSRHAVAMIGVIVWVVVVCGIHPLVYAATVYAGTSVLMLRSFAEHRANEGIFERTAVVENARFFGPLFLFNNLHAAHHDSPLIPWYRLPAWYKANRDRLVTENKGLVYNGYGDVARQFLFAPHDSALHPHGVRAGDRAQTAAYFG